MGATLEFTDDELRELTLALEEQRHGLMIELTSADVRDFKDRLRAQLLKVETLSPRLAEAGRGVRLVRNGRRRSDQKAISACSLTTFWSGVMPEYGPAWRTSLPATSGAPQGHFPPSTMLSPYLYREY